MRAHGFREAHTAPRPGSRRDRSSSQGEVYVDKLQLGLAADSPVQKLGDIFAGPCTVNFIIDGSGNTHTIGTAGTIDIARETNRPWPDADVAALTTGTFKVALDCSAAASFTGPDKSANLKVDIRFVAYHEGD